MAMTLSRRAVYTRGWAEREFKIDRKKRRKEYNRKVRHMKIDENASCSRGAIREAKTLMWDTIT